MGFVSILGYAQQLVKDRVHKGDSVIDATIGNGVDTFFLAEQVGSKGTVYGFDIQQAAIDSTCDRFARSDRAMENIRLFHHSHDTMPLHIPKSEHGAIAAIMFNLGYLPGADTSVITRTDTTIQALDIALRLLRPNGILTIVLYPGHQGGDTEAEAVQAWSAQLPQIQCQVLIYRFINSSNTSPYLIAIEKRN